MSAYDRGTQDIAQHRETFARVMNLTIWSSGLIGLSVIFPSLVFAAKMNWLPALVWTFAVGVIFGVLLKKGGAWYATLIGLGVVTALCGFAISALSAVG